MVKPLFTDLLSDVLRDEQYVTVLYGDWDVRVLSREVADVRGSEVRYVSHYVVETPLYIYGLGRVVIDVLISSLELTPELYCVSDLILCSDVSTLSWLSIDYGSVGGWMVRITAPLSYELGRSGVKVYVTICVDRYQEPPLDTVQYWIRYPAKHLLTALIVAYTPRVVLEHPPETPLTTTPITIGERPFPTLLPHSCLGACCFERLGFRLGLGLGSTLPVIHKVGEGEVVFFLNPLRTVYTLLDDVEEWVRGEFIDYVIDLLAKLRDEVLVLSELYTPHLRICDDATALSSLLTTLAYVASPCVAEYVRVNALTALTTLMVVNSMYRINLGTCVRVDNYVRFVLSYVAHSLGIPVW